MTTREKRGGPRVPDGVPRPPSAPLAQGPNRSDLSQLPGTPGTTLPGAGSGLPHGQAGPVKRALSQIPLDKFNPSNIDLRGKSSLPNEAVTSGSPMGSGVGPEGMLPSPNTLSDRIAAKEMQSFYPILARLASLPGATTQTKILAQRIRANLPVSPDMMPLTPIERRDRDGVPGPTGEDR